MTCPCVIASEAKQSNGVESFMILASYTVGCRARTLFAAMTNRDATLTLNMTIENFACAILRHCEAIAEVIKRHGIFHDFRFFAC